MKCAVLIGPPGCGKSTIGKLAADKLGFCYVSSGDIARQIAKVDSITSTNLKEGKLADENRMREELYNTLSHISNSGKGIILDGFPRFADQVVWLRRIIPDAKFYLIKCSIETCIARLTERCREDDQDDIINKRVQYYLENCKDVLSLVDHETIYNCIGDDINDAAYKLETMINGGE